MLIISSQWHLKWYICKQLNILSLNLIKNWQAKGLEGLDFWVRVTQKQQLLWDVPGLQWSKEGPWSLIQLKSLKLKLMKRLLQVLIEGSQNNQCFSVCFVWSCVAADQLGCQCLRTSTKFSSIFSEDKNTILRVYENS